MSIRFSYYSSEQFAINFHPFCAKALPHIPKVIIRTSTLSRYFTCFEITLSEENNNQFFKICSFFPHRRYTFLPRWLCHDGLFQPYYHLAPIWLLNSLCYWNTMADSSLVYIDHTIPQFHYSQFLCCLLLQFTVPEDFFSMTMKCADFASL